MGRRAGYVLALALQLLGAAAVLLLSSRRWQTVTTPGAFHTDVLEVSGKTLDAAPFALALVALAGIVAVLATRGWWRRVVGGIVALAGIGMVWRCLAAASAVSAAHARALVRAGDSHATFSSTIVPAVTVHPAWAVLSAVAAVLVVAAGAIVAIWGGRWSSMSARYEAPVAAVAPEDLERDRQRADARLWTALDRGEDPT